jgi:hypothetical protein
MDAGELLVWARFGTFVPGDQEDESPRKVISGMSDWMFRNITEFPGCIQLVHGDYLPVPYRVLGQDRQKSKLLVNQTCFNYQLNAQFLFSIIIYVLHYNSRHVSSNTMPILRRSKLYCYSIWYRQSEIKWVILYY